MTVSTKEFKGGSIPWRSEIAATAVEEVSMKWMDRPSVTVIDRGGVYEMDRQTKFPKKRIATEMDQIKKNDR